MNARPARRFVAYYRVSTDRHSRSSLCLRVGAIEHQHPEAAAAAVICYEWLQRPECPCGSHSLARLPQQGLA
jgi:hypothetical protein